MISIISCPPQSASGCKCMNFVTFALALYGVLSYYACFIVPEFVLFVTGSHDLEVVNVVLLFCGLCLSIPSYLMMLISLYRVIASNPGFVPAVFSIANVERITSRIVAEQRGQIAPSDTTTEVELLSSENMRRVLPIRFCDKCLVYKLGDVHHCSTCKQCIYRMDHYCPWVGQCVGKCNHKFFLLFLFWTCISGGVFCLTAWKRLKDSGILSEGGASSSGTATGYLLLFGFFLAAMFSLVLGAFGASALKNASEGATTLANMRRKRDLLEKKLAKMRARREHPNSPTREPGEGVSILVHDKAEDSNTEEDDEDSCTHNLSEVLGEEGRRGFIGKLMWLIPTAPQFHVPTDEDVKKEIRGSMNVVAPVVRAEQQHEVTDERPRDAAQVLFPMVAETELVTLDELKQVHQ